MKNLDFLNFIKNRKSVRAYTQEPVSKEDLEEICRAAMSAPSARNQQMWNFIVIDNKSILENLAPDLPNAPMLKTCPAAIIVCGTSDNEWSCYWQQDCSAAIVNALHAIEALGLGGCWCGIFPREERAKAVSATFNIPENRPPLAIITIGHPSNPNLAPKDKWDPKKIHWNKWQ